MIKRSIQEEDITIVNVYVPNIGAPQYIRQTLTGIREEIGKETQTLNHIMEKLELTTIGHFTPKQ